MSGWLPSTLAAVSLLIVAVLSLRAPVARGFGARAAYALWLAPLLRLVLPPLPVPSSPALDAGRDAVEWVVTSGGSAIGSGPEGAPVSPLLLVWLFGAVAYLVVQLVRHYGFLGRALEQGRTLVRDDVACDLVASPAIDGPMATGLIHPLILVPSDFEQRLTPHQQGLALLHEQLHHQRRDLWAAAAAMVVTALLWFNPLAHLALAAFRRDMEAACDADVLARKGQDDAPAYAETILRCATRPVPRSLCALTSIDELKGRLMMLNQNPNLLRRLAGIGVAALVTATGLAVSLPASAEPTQSSEVRKEIRIVEVGKGEKRTDAERLAIEKSLAERKCPEGAEAITAESDASPSADKQEKTRIMICAKSGATTADTIQVLEKSLARIQADGDMPATVKAEIRAKLQARIAELKAR